MNAIEQLFRDRLGLDSAALGPGALEQAVRARMKLVGCTCPEDYPMRLRSSAREWAELVEAVVVPESWFFRDPAAFDGLVRLVSTEWLPAHPGGVLQILSIPCSSGEEPYSLAMALLDMHLPPERFRIRAVDISARALARAREGVYRKNSFRGTPLDFRSRHFRSTQEGFRLNAVVRQAVDFSRGNLFGPGLFLKEASFDFIFCRNLLIYCHPAAQQRALTRLASLLSPAGGLFLGPAEYPLALAHGFLSADLPRAFACRKPGPALAQAAGPLGPLEVESCRLKVPGSAPYPPGGGAADRPGEATAALDHARRLADAGNIAEATALCEAHLRQFRDSANAYYLLGLVREAGGDTRAIDCYRKALYLEPNHYDTLLQMALLADQNGDAAAAQAFKRRAERAAHVK